VLTAFKTCASVTRACKTTDICRDTFYRWPKEDATFKADYEDAREQAIDCLEDEALRRAHEGIEKPVTIAGKREVIREYSDSLLIFLLKAHRPQKYRDNIRQEISGADGAPLVPANHQHSPCRGGQAPRRISNEMRRHRRLGASIGRLSLPRHERRGAGGNAL
jgi:hypothetical protein